MAMTSFREVGVTTGLAEALAPTDWMEALVQIR